MTTPPITEAELAAIETRVAAMARVYWGMARVYWGSEILCEQAYADRAVLVAEVRRLRARISELERALQGSKGI